MEPIDFDDAKSRVFEKYGKCMELLAHQERLEQQHKHVQIPFLELNGIGWIPIIETLIHEADVWNEKCNIEDKIVIDQIKEKYGSLRFYFHGGSIMFRGMVRFAEQISKNTCEACGCVSKNQFDCTRCKINSVNGWGKGKDE
jgi:hypothetical protein